MSLDTLLAALHSASADRLGWLALADCLEEENRPRQAELMRLFVIARDQPSGAERDWSEAQVRRLLDERVQPCGPGFVNSIGMQLALVPPGEFLMGSPGTEESRHDDEILHRITISHPFYAGVHQVTQQQYAAVMKRNPSRFCSSGEYSREINKLDTTSFPVENVAWADAVAFCEHLSALPEEQAVKRIYRLPTEAEWEYAARGAGLSRTPFHFGTGHILTHLDATFDANRPYGPTQPGPWLNRPTPVASYLPNVLGLYDVHGNVWEWCQDWYATDYYSQSPPRDPVGPGEGEYKVLRGGSWFYNGPDCRVARRYRWRPEAKHRDHGFRVVCTIAEAP